MSCKHFVVILGLMNVVAAGATRGSPLESVVTMLEDLQNKVLVEGKAEAKTYDKFACFCKDKSSDKADEITEVQDQVAELEASIVEEMEFRDRREQTIKEQNIKLALNDKEETKRTAERKAQSVLFYKTKQELEELRYQLKWAIMTLMAEDAGISAEELHEGRTTTTTTTTTTKIWELDLVAKHTEMNLTSSHPGAAAAAASYWKQH